jgi:hypothetical protein
MGAATLFNKAAGRAGLQLQAFHYVERRPRPLRPMADGAAAFSLPKKSKLPILRTVLTWGSVRRE